MVTRYLIIFCTLIACCGCSTPPPITHLDVTIRDKTFKLEIAKDLIARRDGLMHREAINKNEGMIFIFPDAQERSFWMKNCLIPIDIIFLDSRGTVTAVHAMLSEPPKTNNESDFVYEQRLSHYWSYGPARFAIEFSAGTIQELELRVNDHVDLDLQELKRIAR